MSCTGSSFRARLGAYRCHFHCIFQKGWCSCNTRGHCAVGNSVAFFPHPLNHSPNVVECHPARRYKNEGIFYNRYLESESAQDGTETETNTNQKLYYHKLGTSQSEDVLVWENPAEPEWMSSSEVTDDDRYLVLYLTHGCRPENLVWVVDLETTPIATIAGAWAKPIDSWVGQFDYIANDGADFVFTTTHSAPLKRVVRIPEFNKPAATDPSSWTELIPEKPEMIEFAKAVASDLVAVEYIKDVKSQLAVFKLVDGSHVRDIPIPVGTVAGFSGKRKLSEVFFKFTSFLEPGAVYQLADFADDSAPPKLIKTTELPGGLDLSMFETKQVFYPSKDGTKIPMFIVSRAGLQQDESNPTLLYGYGGFNISLTPSFSVSRLIWCQHFGGILCVANIRGGGEYGLSWHDAGKCENKQNCFTDFVAAAQYLVAEKYTKPERIAIQGGSNGGLLVCACANQAPTEIRAVVAQVGVLDILRFHKFTIGHAWTSDFGNPDVEKDFGVAKAYSPLHNVVVPPSDGSWQYPSMMLLTADHDDRVSPLHSLKHIAELQHTAGSSTGQTNPLLIKVDTKSGHGAGKPTSKRIEEAAHVYAFIADATGATWKS